MLGLFRYPPCRLFPPVAAVATATSVFTEYVFWESVESANYLQVSRTFEEADCMLKLVKVNKPVVAITFLNRRLSHTAWLSISYWGNINFVSRAGGIMEKTQDFNM